MGLNWIVCANSAQLLRRQFPVRVPAEKPYWLDGDGRYAYRIVVKFALVEESLTSRLDNIKVVGFDNWSRGALHFERLVQAFKNEGMRLTLLHLGSWGNDRGRPDAEWIRTLPVRDISYYGRDSFPDILDKENPAAVLFMSTDTFAHRAFNRYCQNRNLPTLHLYHGLVRVQAVDGGLPYRTNVTAQLRFASSKIPKAIRHVWPTYSRALWETEAEIADWYRFGKDIFNGALGRYAETSARDARADKCCVYTGADIEHAIKKYGFGKDDVVAVGNPDLAQFGLDFSRIGSHLAAGHVKHTEVMYVGTGLMHTGLVFASEAEYIRHIVDTRDALKHQLQNLVFKPHPADWRTRICSELIDAGVDVCSDQDFVDRLKQCCACIVEPSSLSIIPALMGMPLFLARYGKLTNQRYGHVLTSYPRARNLLDIEYFSSLLSVEQAECDGESTTHWIKSNSGPLPAEEMPRRVAEIVASMIVERQAMHQ